MSADVPDVRQTRLDNYVDRYAARTKGMTASEIRALFSVASRPEVVSLAGGMPNIGGLPLDVVGGAVRDLVIDNGATAMQYGSGQGDPTLRDQICDVMRLEGIDAHPDDVVVTVGSQQAVDLVTRVFCDPGDVVICEAPSYVGALGVFRAYQCEVVHVAMDDDGVVPEALEQAIAAVRAAGKRIKFFYTIPNFHNPAGVSLSDERRRRVLEICQRADLLVLEDNPYGLLGFDGEPQRALRADDREGVIYLGSFSKTFAPGFRVGWAVAPHAVREKLVLAQESATLCPPVFSQLAISSYLSRHDWLGQVKQFREMYRERRDAMLVGADRKDACGNDLDQAGRRVLCLADPAGRPGREGDAAAGGHRPGGVRPRNGLLRRRFRLPVHAVVVLSSDAGTDHRGGRPAGRGDPRGARAAADVRAADAGSGPRLRRSGAGAELTVLSGPLRKGCAMDLRAAGGH